MERDKNGRTENQGKGKEKKAEGKDLDRRKRKKEEGSSRSKVRHQVISILALLGYLVIIATLGAEQLAKRELEGTKSCRILHPSVIPHMPPTELPVYLAYHWLFLFSRRGG